MKAKTRKLTAVMLTLALALSIGVSAATTAINGGSRQMRRGDVDGDGNVSVQDALEILRYLVELPSALDGDGRYIELGILPEPSPEPADITPLMWRVTAPGGQTMYLFGSIHAADETIYPLPLYVTDAFERSDYLAVEVDILNMSIASSLAMQEMFFLPEGTYTSDIIDEELLARAKEVIFDNTPDEILEMLEELGHDIDEVLEELYLLEPYAWTSELSNFALELAGMSSWYGLEVFFIEAADELEMPIIELETIEQQMGVLLGFSPELQTLLLEEALDLEVGAEAVRALFELWKTGDYDGLAELLAMEDMPEELREEYNNALLMERDILMTEVIRELLAAEQKVFTVVGVAHLVGDDSIVYLLRAEGYEVELVSPVE